MSEWIYGTIYKSDGTTAVAKNILIQIDKMDAKEAAEYQNGDPHFTYRFYTTQLPTTDVNLVQQRYYVVDQYTKDPTTSQARKYLIISDPQPKSLMMTWQWVGYRYRGT